MSSKKYIDALYRAEDYKYIEELLIRLEAKNITRDKLIIYSGIDNIYSLEIANKIDKDLKFKIIAEVKKYIRHKIKQFDGKTSLYTYLSLFIPDSALYNYKLNNISLGSIYSGEQIDENRFFSYREDLITHTYSTKELAIKKAVEHASKNAFIYMTRKDYA